MSSAGAGFGYTQWRQTREVAGMYDEYSRSSEPPPIVCPWRITLLGAHRHLRCQFLYNTLTQSIVSTKADHAASLPSILQNRFGQDALGVVCAGRVYHDEEGLIRSGACPAEGARLHVVYDEEAPEYQGAHKDARILQHEDGRLLTLPVEDTRQSENGQQDGNGGDGRHRLGSTRTGRIEGYTYYESIPTLNKTITLQFADGTQKPILLTNKSVEQADQVVHFLSLYGGDRWVGIKVGEKEYVNDDVLFDKSLVDGQVYPVTYRQPSGMSILAKAKDKRNNVVYSSLPL